MPVNVKSVGPRSPRYPRVSLDSAVQYATLLYHGVHRSVVDTNSAYKIMGFSGKTGASATAMGGVRQFGLVDGLRGDLKISSLALRILEPENEAEKVEALREASTNPEVFRRIIDHFDGSIPAADEAIRALLIRQLNFSPTGADDCISSLRETLAFVGEMPSGAEFTNEDSEAPEPIEPATGAAARIESTGPMLEEKKDPDQELIRVPLSSSSHAEIRISGQVTAEGMDRLIRYLELMKDVWAE